MSVFENPQVEVTVQPSGTFSISPGGAQPIVGKGTWIVIPNSVSDLDVNNFSIQVPVKAQLPRRPLVSLTLSLSFTIEIRRNLFQLVQQYIATAQGFLVSIGGLAGAVLAIVGLVERIRKKPAPPSTH